ncbi:MAG: hypothetical protein IAG13_14495 [Deltaproteobacteria bacterium]|nr:hypothetical protein [Nannocystaceae bacterium]
MDIKHILEQRELCERYGTGFVAAPAGLKVGVSRNLREGLAPVNGMRHPVSGDTTGWYIWAGEELSPEPDFFVPLHVEHLVDWCPEALRFLGLPPGWRFLLAGEYVDVWEDPSLLDG